MAAPRLFVAAPLARALVGREIALPDATAHHALRVRRLVEGDALVLFDGAGGEYAATLVHAGKRDARVRLDTFGDGVPEPTRRITVAQALVATDTMDTIVRHAVELGASAVQPLVTAHGAPFPAGAHGDKRIAHWRGVAIAACEQCGRNRVPEVAAPLALSAWIAQRPEGRAGIVLVPGSSTPWVRLAPPPDDFDLLVGPEGGLTAEEIAQASAARMQAASLGPRVLRAQTATLAALAAASLLWEGR